MKKNAEKFLILRYSSALHGNKFHKFVNRAKIFTMPIHKSGFSRLFLSYPDRGLSQLLVKWMEVRYNPEY